MHYRTISQLAKNNTCTTQISYSLQRIIHALHKYLTVSNRLHKYRIKHALHKYLTVCRE